MQITEDDEIDVNNCCMCFGSYEDDVQEGYEAEWMKCLCCMLSALKIRLWIAQVKVASAHIALMDYDLLSLAHSTLLLDSKSICFIISLL